MQNVTVPNHPLLRHKITLLRDPASRPRRCFARWRAEISLLMAYEVTRDLPLEPIDIERRWSRCAPMAPRRQETLHRVHPARRQWHPGGDAGSGALRPRVAISGCIAIRRRCRRSNIT